MKHSASLILGVILAVAALANAGRHVDDNVDVGSARKLSTEDDTSDLGALPERPSCLHATRSVVL